MREPEFDWTHPRRQSPVALLFIFGRVLKEFWPLFLFLAGRRLFGGSDDKPDDGDRTLYVMLGLMATFLCIGLYYVVEYLRFRFHVQAGELVVDSGVFVRKKTVIPLEKVQSVHLRQNWINRLTGTYGLKVETAGTDDEELEIKAMSGAEAESLQGLLRGGRPIVGTPEAHSSDVVLGMRPVDLVKLAVSENHIKTMLLILAFAMARFDDFRQFFGAGAGKAIDERVGQFEFVGRTLAVLAGGILALTLAVSLIRVWLRYHGMQLRMGDAGFQMQWGFLQTHRKQLLQEKVQMVSWNANLLRRLLGIRVIRFFMAGEAVFGKTEQWIRVPVMREEVLASLTAAYRRDPPSGRHPGHRVHPAYGWRKTLMAALPVYVLLTVAAALWKPGWVLLPLPLFLYVAVSNLARRRRFRFWYDSRTLELERGVWGREHLLLNLERVQHVVMRTTPFQRSKGLTTLELHTAGPPVAIPYMPEDQARHLADLCLVNVEFGPVGDGDFG